MYAARPASLEIMMRSTGQLADVRIVVAMSAWLFTGTKRMCPDGIRMRVRRFSCHRIDVAAQGLFSHTRRISSAKKAVSAVSEDTRACRIALRMSSGSHSRLAIYARLRSAIAEGVMYMWPPRDYSGH